MRSRAVRHCGLVAALAGILAGSISACRDGGPESGRPSATGILVLRGAGQSDTIGAPLRDTLLVEVRDSSGRLRRGALVRFQTEPAPDGRIGVLLGQGYPWALSTLHEVRSDSLGRARIALTLGTLAGRAYVWVKVPELDAFDTVAVTVRPGAPLRITTTPRDTAVYVAATITLAVATVDRAGNALPDPTIQASGPLQLTGTTVRASGIGRGVIALRADRAVDTVWVSVVPRATIAGIYARGPVGDEQGIVLTELDGSNRRALLDAGRQNMLPWGPMWSPDGSRIVYTPPYGNDEVRLIDLSGKVTRLVPLWSSGLAFMVWAQYSRDGAWIYFSAHSVPYSTSYLYRVRPDGTGLERVNSDTLPSEYVLSSSPSPDGRRIVAGRASGTLAVLDLGTLTWTELGVRGHVPRWSPLDDRIAFINGQGASAAVQVVRADGTGLRTLATGDYRDGIDWSPDARWLILRGPSTLVVASLDTGEILPIAQLRDIVAATWKP